MVDAQPWEKTPKQMHKHDARDAIFQTWKKNKKQKNIYKNEHILKTKQPRWSRWMKAGKDVKKDKSFHCI